MLPDVAVHIIQRGNNRQAFFYHWSDYHRYLDWLSDYANEKYQRKGNAFI